MPTRTLRSALPVALVTALLTLPGAAPAQAGPADVAAAPTAGPVFAATDGLARQLAAGLADQDTRRALVPAATTGPVDLFTVRTPGLAAAVRAANARVLDAKGLPADTGSVLRLRLAHPDLRAALTRGVAPLVAATPTDDTPSTVTAYDRTGGAVRLDPTRVPAQPVLLVEVDTRRALAAGLTLMRAELARRGVTGSAPAARTAPTASAGYWATRVDAVRLDDDKEPWIKGAAEIYSVVAGFGLDGKAKVDLVQMPYLDDDGTTYRPNQLLVHFNGYKYNLADVVMMEDDGDTNYQALVRAIASALLVIVDGGAYQPLVSAILDAIPSSWYTDDPDYVDSWYTLSTGSTGRLDGAAGNGWLEVSPYFVQPL